MNPHTGELIEVAAGQKLPDGFQELTNKRLAQIAKAEIARVAPEPARVDLKGNTPLSRWARKKRRAKIAAASRRKNRK